MNNITDEHLNMYTVLCVGSGLVSIFLAFIVLPLWNRLLAKRSRKRYASKVSDTQPPEVRAIDSKTNSVIVQGDWRDVNTSATGVRHTGVTRLAGRTYKLDIDPTKASAMEAAHYLDNHFNGRETFNDPIHRRITSD